MSKTTASALNNRVVNFVNNVNDYTCVICNQVADQPNTCSGLGGGVFCDGCSVQALALFDLSTIALKDNDSRMKIFDKDVYCLNSIKPETSRKRKVNREDKCLWSGKYDQLAAHLDRCDYEKLPCTIDGCQAMIERGNFQHHWLSCGHRTEECNNCAITIRVRDMHDHLNMDCPKVVVDCQCGFECVRDALLGHRDKDCPLVEIQCDLVGCGALLKRGDYDKHQEEERTKHIVSLSAVAFQLAVNIKSVERENTKLLELVNTSKRENEELKTLVKNIEAANRLLFIQVGNVKQENDRLRGRLDQISKVVEETIVQKIVRITDITKKMKAATVQEKSFDSPSFDLFYRGNHKIYMQAEIQGNRLGLDLCKDIENSEDKSSLCVGGSSITISKAGKIDRKRTFPLIETMDSSHWSIGWKNFLEDVRPFIDNDGINVIIDLKFNKVDEPLVL